MAGSENTTTAPGGRPPLAAPPPDLFDRVCEIRRARAFTPLVAVLRKLQGCRCFYCMAPLSARHHVPGRRERGWTRDHVRPRAKGGGNACNVVLACFGCNQLKGDRLPSALELAAARQLWAAVLVIKPAAVPAGCRPSDLLN